MQYVRASLITASLSLLFGVAADPSPAAPAHRHADPAPSGLFADYLDGRFALAEADPDAAAEAFLHALAIDPTNADIQQQAFGAALFAGRPEALVLARQLSDNPVAQLLLANREVKSGNWEGAEQRFRALSRQGATQLLQPLLLAWAEQGAGKTDAALNTLRPYVEGQRFRGVYALHAAMIADLAGRTADAGRLYQLAATQYGGPNIRLAQILASWQARQGHTAEALGTLKALGEGAQEVTIALPGLAASLNNRPVGSPAAGIAEAYLALAAALNAQEATNFSLPLLRLALDLEPNDTAARLLLSEIYQSAHHEGPAERVLASVAQNDTLYPVVALRRAALEAEDGRIDEAMAQLQQVARANADSSLPLAQEGDLLRSKNRFDEAITAYDGAIARLPAEPPASAWPLFYARGIAEERAHHWPKAEADFQHALRLAPDQPYVLNYLGYTWADQGSHLDEARQMLEKAATQRPNDGSIVDSLGWVLLRQGQSAEAVHSLEQAVELSPEDATVNGHLGDAYWAVGRKLEATYQWRRALTLNPDPDDAAKLEAKLRDDANPALAASPGPEHRFQ